MASAVAAALRGGRCGRRRRSRSKLGRREVVSTRGARPISRELRRPFRADDHEYGHVDRRRGGPTAVPACRCRSSAGSRPGPPRCCGGGRRAGPFDGVEPGEQRVGQPLVDEGLDTDRLDARRRARRRRVVGQPVRRRRRSRRSRRSSTSRSTNSGCASAACSATRAAHRVADVGRLALRSVYEMVGALPTGRRATSVALPCPGMSTATTSAAGQPSGEQIGERRPTTARSG